LKFAGGNIFKVNALTDTEGEKKAYCRQVFAESTATEIVFLDLQECVMSQLKVDVQNLIFQLGKSDVYNEGPG
jgi:hypothetical protein